MKKLLSIMLSLVMAISILVVPASVSAKETKKTQNTYVARYSADDTGQKGINIPKKGVVNCTAQSLYFKKTNGKVIKLEKTSLKQLVNNYYVRGENVYYVYVHDRLHKTVCDIRTVGLNGKNKKTLYSKKYSSFRDFNLIGGYGSGINFYERNYNKKTKTYTYTVKMYKNKKVTVLFKVNSKSEIEFKTFAGKIFYNNRAYDLAKKAKISYVASNITVTNNYMYYVNKNNNLKSLDKKDVRRVIAKNIYSYFTSDHNNTVIYSRLNSDNNEVFYQKTGSNKEVKLCLWKDIVKVINDGTYFTGKTEYDINPTSINTKSIKQGIIFKGKVYFIYFDGDSSYAVSVDLNNGKIKYVGKYLFVDMTYYITTNNNLSSYGLDTAQFDD